MPRASALGRAMLCAAAIGGTAACNDYLKVTNPNAQPIEGIDADANLTLLLNGAIGEFQSAVGDVAIYGATLSDEVTAAHANNSYRDLDRRDFTNTLDLDALTYRPVQRARFTADTTATILRARLGDSASTDVRLARALALAGYSRVILGETFCAAPINLSAPLTPAELFAQAVQQFDSAATIATAAKAAGRGGAAADSLLGLALVGAARASLDQGKKPEAIAYAARVPANFVYRAYFSEGIPVTTGLPVNPFWNATGSAGTAGLATGNSSNGIAFSSASLWVIVGPSFQGLNDPRMPITTNRVATMSTTTGLSTGFVPLKPASYGGYTRAGVAITPGSSIRVASTLEAQYITAEANGGNAATRTFVDQQRSANGLAALPATATPAEVLADLRDQRRREFYLDGHRLGDIRRYKSQYNVDFFPSGAYLGTTPYGTVECFPIPISEINANPNVPNT